MILVNRHDLLPSRFQRISELVPRDLLDYVSFIDSSTAYQESVVEGSSFLTSSEGNDAQCIPIKGAKCDNSHPLFGLWTGSFDVANRSPGEPVQNKVEEMFFLLGYCGEELLGDGFTGLPPEPTVDAIIFDFCR